MNDLHKAYNVLGLEPGTSLEAILRRYKRLIMVWHPDRFPTEDGKKDAEEELKKINNAKDKLKDHFEKGGHSASESCACKAEQAHGTRSQTESSYGGRSGPSPGPGQRRKTTEERQRDEEAAKRRSEERRRQEEAEAKRRAEEQAKAQAEANQQQAFQQAMKYEEQHKYDSLCWKISLACGGIFVLLMVVALAADGIEDMIISAENAIFGLHESPQDSARHSDDWSKYIDDRQRVASQILGRPVSMNEILDWRPPYSDPNGSPIARAVYERLNPPAPPPSVNPPSPFNFWGNTNPSSMQPNIDIHPTSTPGFNWTPVPEKKSFFDSTPLTPSLSKPSLSGQLKQILDKYKTPSSTDK